MSLVHQSDPISGSRDSASLFRRYAGTWTVDALIDQYAFFYAAAAPTVGNWLPITDNDTTTITVTGTILAAANTVKTCAWNPIEEEFSGYGSYAFGNGCMDGMGNLWLAPFGYSKIVKINTATGTKTEFTPPHSGSFWGCCCVGTDIWFAPHGNMYLTKINADTGVFTEYYDASFTGTTFVGAIYDGTSVWLVPHNYRYVVKVNPADGSMTKYDVGVNNWPLCCEGCFDGEYIWLSPWQSPNIIRVTASTGVITLFAHNYGPYAFHGAVFDGYHVWFAPAGSDKILRIDKAGSIVPVVTLSTPGGMWGCCYDGQNVWFSPHDNQDIIAINRASWEVFRFAHGKGAEAFDGAVYDGNHVWYIPAYATSIIKSDVSRLRGPIFRTPAFDIAWQPPVDTRATAPTEIEVRGTRYIIKATATGIFTGLENKVATAKQLNPTLIEHWYIDTPKEGHRCRVLDENVDYQYDGSSWVFQPDASGFSTAISSVAVNVSTVSAGLSAAVAVNSTQTANISTNTAGISTATANNSTHSAKLSIISTGISTANANISTNVVNNSTNVANISTVSAGLPALTASISTVSAGLSTVNVNNSTNVANNSTNTANISTNTANISTLSASCSTATANISTISAGLSSVVAINVTQTANISTLSAELDAFDLSGKQDLGTYIDEEEEIEFSIE